VGNKFLHEYEICKELQKLQPNADNRQRARSFAFQLFANKNQ
jgi:hypothetical protein